MTAKAICGALKLEGMLEYVAYRQWDDGGVGSRCSGNGGIGRQVHIASGQAVGAGLRVDEGLGLLVDLECRGRSEAFGSCVSSRNGGRRARDAAALQAFVCDA
jgi:hypothetical protein